MSKAEKFIVAAVAVAVSVYVLSEIAFWRAALGQSSRFQVPSSKLEYAPPGLEPGTWNLEPVRLAQVVDRDEVHEALAEVNALRRARGLRPFVFDEALTRGAKNVARFRARRLMAGHTADDFRGLPRGIRADAAGCAAWHGDDWGSCCTFENYRFAGAAWCRGRDGRRYMHLFVRR